MASTRVLVPFYFALKEQLRVEEPLRAVYKRAAQGCL
jgi:hypothetical protein